MEQIILEILKWVGICLVSNISLALILRYRSKVEYKLGPTLVELPIIVGIEELIFRLGLFFLFGVFTNCLPLVIGIAAFIFALVHIPNLKTSKTEVTSAEKVKYTTIIFTLGCTMGYIYSTQGLFFVYAVHLIYDYIAIGCYALSTLRNKK